MAVIGLESRKPSWYEAYSILIVGGAAVYIPLSYAFNFHLPTNPLKLLTGMPCPLCGGTRAVTALAIGDFLLALAYNPLALVVLALMLFSIVSYFGFVVPFRRRPIVQATPRQRDVVRIVVIVAFLLNWVYVLATGYHKVPLDI